MRIHAPFPGGVGQYFVALTRIAVPIFFMITGFFYDNTVQRDRVAKQIKKIFVLLLQANLLYFLWKLFLAMLGSGSNDYIETTFTIKALLKFAFLNESPFNGHLWYLGAILYVLIIVALVDRCNGRNLLYAIMPLLLIGDLILGKYSILILGREFPYIIVRNFLFVGLPYFYIGALLYEHRNGIAEVFNHKRTHLLFTVAVFAVTSLLERFILVAYALNATRDHYVSTTFLAIAVFIFFMIKGKRLSKGGQLLSVIGKNDSTWVYIIHPIFVTVLFKVSSKIGLAKEYGIIQPIIVFIISIMAVEIFRKIKSNLMNLYGNRRTRMARKEYKPHHSTRYKHKTEDGKKALPELYENRENCCGCSACYAVCPVGAISMEPDEEGFLYPTVDAEKCIRCYKCLKVCAFKGDQKKKGYIKAV